MQQICCLVIVGVLFHLCNGVEYNHTIYIDPENGHDNSSCINSNSPSVLCRSLDFALRHRANSTQYVLVNGTHFLNNPVETFEQLETIAFTGTDMDTTIIECTSDHDIGFAFVDISTLHFSNLTFNGCSALRHSTTRIFSKPTEFALYENLVGLYFYHCHNVEMSHVTVSNSPNATGVVMYDTDGTVAITDSVFNNNTVPLEDDKRLHPGGGGFYVEFSYCIPGDTTCKNDSKNIISHESNNHGAEYLFSHCTFSHNSANNLDDATSSYIIPYRADHEAFGRGGGLSIFFKGNASANTFVISDCQFVSNHALWGAGLFFEFHDDTGNNTVNVSESIFFENTCSFTTVSGTGGGGMRIGHYIYTNNSVGTGNRIFLNTLIFDNNSALTGGGLSISPTLQAVGHLQITTITILNSTFTNNVARLGAAIHIDRFSLIINGLMLNISIEVCTIFDNSNDYVRRIQGYNGKPYPVGIGAVYIKNIHVWFKNRVNLFRNNGSALAVVGSSVDFTNCSAFFSENTGNSGAGIALLGAAYIQINEETKMYFFSNTATNEGGAIYNKYIERENLKSHTNCFIRHVDYLLTPDKWGSTFTFYNNHDHRGERLSAIHATSILPCAWAGGSRINSSSVFCWDGWDYGDHVKKNCTEQISTDVGEISFTPKNDDFKAFPGIPFSLPIRIHDDLQDNVKTRTVFFASIDAPNSSIGIGNNNFTYVSGESTVIKGVKQENVVLHLDTLGDRVWHMEMTVELQPCPPGFIISSVGNKSEGGVCKCESVDSMSSLAYNGALICDPDSLKLFLKNNHWMGKLSSGGDYFVSQCPPGFCNSDPHSAYVMIHNGKSWNSSQNLDNFICGGKYRKNISCGQCLENYGPAVNSPTYDCILCNHTKSHIAKYVASIYIPLFFMFTILILFDIRLTMGPANAFILYCQVVASTFDLDADGQIPLNLITKRSNQLLQAYRFPYGIFNLEFIENFLPPLCLGTRFNNLSVFLLDYAVALAPILMIVIIILCVKLKEWITERCKCFNTRSHTISRAASQRAIQLQRNISEAMLPAFAAFILLSYTKFSITSSYLIHYQPLIYQNGSYDSYRAYYAGQFAITDTEYVLKYMLPAIIIFATFVLIPPLLLLDYPLRGFERVLGKVDCLWRFYPVDKIHVFLDTFQGCYKNKMRFFAGLYFLFRLAVNASYAFTNTWLEQYVIQQLACAIMIMLLAICQPYNDENKVFNHVDTFIFTNLAALNSLSFYMYSFSQNNAHVHPPTSAFVVQYILVFLPLFYMLGYIIKTVLLPRIVTKCAACLRYNGYQPLVSVARNFGTLAATGSRRELGTSTEIEHMLERAKLDNTYQPSNPSHGASVHADYDTKSSATSNDSGLRSTKSSSAGPRYGSTNSTYQSTHTLPSEDEIPARSTS